VGPGTEYGRNGEGPRLGMNRVRNVLSGIWWTLSHSTSSGVLVQSSA
jgi:hypothetical protein